MLHRLAETKTHTTEKKSFNLRVGFENFVCRLFLSYYTCLSPYRTSNDAAPPKAGTVAVSRAI